MDKAPSTRQLKVAREIQKDMAEILRSKGMAAFQGAMVTVSEVRVSPDLAVAKVYVSIFPSDKGAAVMDILQENGQVAFRHRLTGEVNVTVDGHAVADHGSTKSSGIGFQ